MRPGAYITIGAASRLYAPLMALFALSLLAGWPAGSGVGFVAGLVFALALVLHGLVFGAAAARRAFPPVLCRLVAALGLIAASVGAGVPGLALAPRIVEAGLFAVTLAGASMILSVLFGRAPTLRDAEW